jgi:hypothetical protein
VDNYLLVALHCSPVRWPVAQADPLVLRVKTRNEELQQRVEGDCHFHDPESRHVERTEVVPMAHGDLEAVLLHVALHHIWQPNIFVHGCRIIAIQYNKTPVLQMIYFLKQGSN